MANSSTVRKSMVVAVSLASVLSLLVGGVQLGAWAADRDGEKVMVEVEGRLTHIVGSLPAEKQSEARRVLDPVLSLVAAASNQNPEALERATDEVTKVLDASLLDYTASASPFVPPLEKVQFLCGDRFQMTYLGSIGRTSSFHLGLPDELPSREVMSPGAVEIVENGRERLSVTLLEHREDVDAPLLKYTCRM